MKDWKTTVTGYLTIAGAVCTAGIAFLHGQTAVGIGALTTGVPAGIGLIKAADSK